MLLTIVLIVFTVVLILLGVGIFIWWRKFGKQFFEMSKNLTKMNQNMFKSPNSLNSSSFPKDLNEQMKIIQDFLKKR
jgi:predicted PurR-regulated permease PerM